MRQKLYLLYLYILKKYIIDINYIFSIKFLSNKFSISEEFLTSVLKYLNIEDNIIYIDKRRSFKITYKGYLLIKEEVQSFQHNILLILSMLTSIIVSIFSLF